MGIRNLGSICMFQHKPSHRVEENTSPYSCHQKVLASLYLSWSRWVPSGDRYGRPKLPKPRTRNPDAGPIPNPTLHPNPESALILEPSVLSSGTLSPL